MNQSHNVVSIALPDNPSPLDERVAETFQRHLAARCAQDGSAAGGCPPPDIALAIDPALGAEAYRVDDIPGGLRVSGGDERGLLYGLGKVLRTSRFDPEFELSAWRGASAPARSLRGIYFATHFHNYYHTAPVEDLEWYVEEMALWGFNCLMAWYDCHHFTGFDDPAAVAFRERLHRLFAVASGVGIGAGLIVIGNEAYPTSPDDLRADLSTVRGAYYVEDVCPSKPGALDYTLGVLGPVFEWAAAQGVTYICIWPYDPGSCGCAGCRPWGASGFVRCVDAIASLARGILPRLNLIVSSWYMEVDEWRAFGRALAASPTLADIVMVEDPALFEDGKWPADVPLIGFPEISMEGMWPWGGFGANPQPRRFAAAFRRVASRLAGGFPYSEGIFEDVNKFVWAQLYWAPERPVEDILCEYAAHEFSPDIANEMLRVFTTLERNHHDRWWPGELEGVMLTQDWFPSRGVAPMADEGAEEAFAAMRRMDERLPARARASWRWRILYLRALLDSRLKANGGAPDEECMTAFRELAGIYHVVPATDPTVRPPIDQL